MLNRIDLFGAKIYLPPTNKIVEEVIIIVGSVCVFVCQPRRFLCLLEPRFEVLKIARGNHEKKNVGGPSSGKNKSQKAFPRKKINFRRPSPRKK